MSRMFARFPSRIAAVAHALTMTAAAVASAVQHDGRVEAWDADIWNIWPVPVRRALSSIETAIPTSTATSTTSLESCSGKTTA